MVTLKTEFQLPNGNMSVRSVRLETGIHKIHVIHEIQQICEIYLL